MLEFKRLCDKRFFKYDGTKDFNKLKQEKVFYIRDIQITRKTMTCKIIGNTFYTYDEKGNQLYSSCKQTIDKGHTNKLLTGKRTICIEAPKEPNITVLMLKNMIRRVARIKFVEERKVYNNVYLYTLGQDKYYNMKSKGSVIRQLNKKQRLDVYNALIKFYGNIL